MSPDAALDNFSSHDTSGAFIGRSHKGLPEVTG